VELKKNRSNQKSASKKSGQKKSPVPQRMTPAEDVTAFRLDEGGDVIDDLRSKFKTTFFEEPLTIGGETPTPVVL